MTLLTLIGLFAAALFVWRRLRSRAAKDGELEVLSRAGLTQRSGLALLLVSGRRVLIGYGEGSPVLLMTEDVSTEPREAATPMPSPKSPATLCAERAPVIGEARPAANRKTDAGALSLFASTREGCGSFEPCSCDAALCFEGSD